MYIYIYIYTHLGSSDSRSRFGDGHDPLLHPAVGHGSAMAARIDCGNANEEGAARCVCTSAVTNTDTASRIGVARMIRAATCDAQPLRSLSQRRPPGFTSRASTHACREEQLFNVLCLSQPNDVKPSVSYTAPPSCAAHPGASSPSTLVPYYDLVTSSRALALATARHGRRQERRLVSVPSVSCVRRARRSAR